MPAGGHRFAAYQLLKHRTSGATFLFVSTHLSVASGSAGDTERRRETATLLAQASVYAAAHGKVPVVYTGDVKSHEGQPLDGPAVATDAVKVADAQYVAQTRTDAKYSSANQFHQVPLASGLVMDHVYASPGVGVTGWRQILKLCGTTFSGVIPSDHSPVVADLLLPR